MWLVGRSHMLRRDRRLIRRTCIHHPARRAVGPYMGASDRVTLGILGFLSCATFGAIFAATQEKKLERYRKEGRPLPPGFR